MSTCASSNRRRGRGVDGNWLINWRLYLILIDDNGDNAGRICKRSEIWCPKCYWLHLAFSDSMMTADSNCKKSERGTQMYIQRIRRFWYTTRLPPSAVHLSPAHTIRLQHGLLQIFWDAQEIYLYFLISAKSECLIHCFYLVVWLCISPWQFRPGFPGS